MSAQANIHLFDRAITDITTAIDWYQEQRVGLELELLDYLIVNLSQVLRFPHMYRAFGGGFRQLALKKFPYLVIYRVQNDRCYVFAIFHTAQDPSKLI